MAPKRSKKEKIEAKSSIHGMFLRSFKKKRRESTGSLEGVSTAKPSPPSTNNKSSFITSVTNANISHISSSQSKVEPLKGKVEKILTWRWAVVPKLEESAAKVEENKEFDIPAAQPSTSKKLQSQPEREFFVKWKDMSYWHCSWVTEMQLDVYHPSLLRHYSRKSDMEEPPPLDDGSSGDLSYKRKRSGDDAYTLKERFYCYGIRPEWLQVHRIIDHKPLKDGRTMYLIKWRDLKYDQCSWEFGKVFESYEIPDFQKAVNYYWDLRKAAEQVYNKSFSRYEPCKGGKMSGDYNSECVKRTPPPEKSTVDAMESSSIHHITKSVGSSQECSNFIEDTDQEDSSAKGSDIVISSTEGEESDPGDSEQSDIDDCFENLSIRTSLTESKTSNVKSFLVANEGLMILVMPVPSKITFYGQAQIRAISGCVDICGFEISASKPRFYPIYSAKSIFSFPIKSIRCEPMTSQHQEDIKNYLKKCFDQHVISEILSCCKYSSAVVLLKQFRVTHAIDFVSLYHPNIFNLSNKDKETNLMQSARHLNFYVGGMKSSFSEPHTFVSLGEAIVKEIQCRRLNLKPNESTSCIMIYGPKAVGKSSLLRYLVNRVLSVYPSVMYLDLDPGQTEFTPPACLSLTKVSEPLIGPSFTHNRSTIVKTIFYGEVGNKFSSHFNKYARDLYQVYSEKYRDIPLFVNIFEWEKEEENEKDLNMIKRIVAPTIEVKFEETNNDSLSESKVSDAIQFNLNKKEKFRSRMITKRKEYLQELNVLAYLGRCLKPFDVPILLNNLPFYEVMTKDVVLHVVQTHSVYPPSLIKVFNGSFVALCKVEKDNILVCTEHKQCPKKLRNRNHLGEVIGFGFVRAIDEGNGILFFVSPEPPEKLEQVNAFLKGNVNTPSLFKKQDIYDSKIPFLTCRYKIKRQA